MAKEKLTLDEIFSNPTDIARLLSEKRLSDIYDFCDVRFKALKSDRTTRNEKLKQANEEALQISKQKNYPWENASNVKYPLITNASIDFASRIFPAVWQDGDVAKTKYYSDNKDYGAGDRISKYLNFYLAERIPGWEKNLDKQCMAMPINGLMLKKVYFDPEVMAVRSELVFPQDFFVPNEASCIDDASFYFHRFNRSRQEIVGLIRSGIWSNVKEGDFEQEEGDEESLPTDALIRPEDRSTSVYSEVYEVVEGYIYCDLDGDGFAEPYIVTFIPQISKVCRIVPRFDQSGVLLNAEGKIYKIIANEFFVEYSFMESPDGSIYSLGLGELLLPINQAVNSSINQLIDAATLNNMNSGWISKNVRLSQGEAPFQPGEWKAINSFVGKLSDNIMPMPKSEPSQTTFQLLETLINAGAQIAGAQQIKDVQIPSNLSATSSMAIIENGMTGLKAVYKRFHRALTKELRLILQWIARYPNIEEYQAIAGPEATINDFLQIGSIIPVSDPSLITTISKASKAQQLMDLAQQGVIDKNMAAIQICDYAGIDPSTVIPNKPSPMDDIAMQTAIAQRDLIKAQIVFNLANSLRVKYQGIGDVMRADTEGVARSARGLADIRNAMTFKDGETVDPAKLNDEIAMLAKAAGISYQTPVGSKLGEAFGQSIESGVQGTPDVEPNQVEGVGTTRYDAPAGEKEK